MVKYFYIMRASSGNSKSTIASYIAKGFGGTAKIFSTDDFFMVDGKYCYDQSKLFYYHQQTMQNVALAFKHNVECVILDNTNLKAEHVKPYIKLAKQYDYSITFIEVDCGLVESKRRNNTRSEDRKIPETVLENQYKSFKNRFNVDELVK